MWFSWHHKEYAVLQNMYLVDLFIIIVIYISILTKTGQTNTLAYIDRNIADIKRVITPTTIIMKEKRKQCIQS